MNWSLRVDASLPAFRRMLIRVGAGFLLAVLVSLQAGAEEWAVDPEQSRIGFQASQLGAPFEGEFKRYHSSIVFDPEHLDQGKVSFTVEIDSVDTQNAERDAAIRSADWFDAANHPTATFVSEQFTASGDGRYQAKGMLTMRGVTRPVVFPFTFNVASQEGRTIAKVEGTVPVARGDFGVGQGQWASDGVIGNQVVIQVELTAAQ